MHATTPTDSSAPRANFVLVALLGVGLALLALALPRLLGAMSARSARPVLVEIRNERTVSTERLDEAASALRDSLRWSGTPANAFSDLGLLELLQLPPRGSSGARSPSSLPGIIEVQEMGLAGSPASANGWARLAYARYLGEGLAPATRDALEMSLRSGGIDLPLLRFRLYLLLSDWDFSAAESVPAVRDQVQKLTRYGKIGYDELVELSLIAPRGPLIPAVLAETPEKRAYFQRRVERRQGAR